MICASSPSPVSCADILPRWGRNSPACLPSRRRGWRPLTARKPPLCKGRWHPACYARWMTEGLFPRLRCRGRAELGTSQQSLERRAFLARRDVSRASGCFSRVGMPSAARARQGHNWAKRIGEFVSAANSPILFSCLSPIPPGGDKPPPLRQRRGLVRISMEAPESDPAPGARSFVALRLLRMTPLPVSDCGQPGTTSPNRGGRKGVPALGATAFSVGYQGIRPEFAAFYAAKQRACFSIGLRRPGSR